MKRIRFHKHLAVVAVAIILGFQANVAFSQTTPAIVTQGRGDVDYRLDDFRTASGDSLLRDYIRIALENSNALKADFQSWLAVSAEGDIQGALPNPEIMFNYYLNPESYDGVFSQATIGLMQMFPWFGTRAEGRRYAGYLADARWQNLEATRIQIIAEVSESWYNLIASNRNVGHIEEHLEWINRLEALILNRIDVGYATRSDLLRIQIQREEVLSQKRSMELELEAIKTRFNALLTRSTEEEIILPEVSVEVSWETDFVTTFHVAATQSPRIQELNHLRNAGLSMENRARLEGYPMIGVGLELMGSNYVMGMPDGRLPLIAQFRVQVPIWRSKYRAISKQAAAGVKEVDYRKESVHQQIKSELAMYLATYDEAEERIDLYRNRLIPRSRELSDLLLLDYSTGRSSLDDVISARRLSVDYILNLEDALLDRNLAVTALLQLTGVDFNTY